MIVVGGGAWKVVVMVLNCWNGVGGKLCVELCV